MGFKENLACLYCDRENNSIKNDFGKVLILGGSIHYPNAPLISSYFASKSGVGYVSLGVPSSIYDIVASKSILTNIFEPTDMDGDFLFYDEEHLKRICMDYSAILFGNGILDSLENEKVLSFLLSNYTKSLILDATGIKIFARIASQEKRKPNLFLTPHLGEARELLQVPLHSRDPEDYLPYAKKYAFSHSCNLLLKSNRSLFVDQKGEVFPCDSYPSTPSLAKAGSGDGLAGYLAGILAYGEKKLKTEDCVRLADRVIHEAALLSSKEKTAGSGDILSAYEKIDEVIFSFVKD